MMSSWLVSAVAIGAIACGGGGGDDGDDVPSPPVLDESPSEVSNSGSATFIFHAQGATRFECQLDDLAAVTCTSPYTVTVGDGTHTLTITAFAGASALPDPIVITWLVDTTPPDTSITSAPAVFDNSLTTTFTFAGVPANDTASFECALDNSMFTACTSPHTVTTTAGPHTFYARARDLASNVDATPAQHAWTIDSTILDTTITSGPAMASTTQGSVSFTFTASDAAATFECQIDTQQYAPCTTPAQFSNLPEGNHTFSVRARKAAAFDPTPAARTWTVDLTAPPVSITQTPPNQSNDNTPTFAFSSTDASATFECQIDGIHPYTACTSPWTSPVVFQGTRTFRVRATDPAGNPAVAAHSWNCDLTAPPVTIDSGPIGSTTNPNATFQFSSLEGTTTFECQIDGVVAFAACTSPFSHLVPGGAQTFRVRGTDPAGNFATATRTWTVNTPGPTVAITDGPAALGNSSTVTFTFTTAGSVDVLDCSIDGSAFLACTTPKQYTSLGDGDHTFVVRVRDTSGNMNTATRYFTIDTVAPVVSPWFAPPAVTRDKHPVGGFLVSGGESLQTYVMVDGAFGQYGFPPGVYETFPNPPPNGRPVTPFLPLTDGPHSLGLRVYDLAGNHAEHSYNFVVDTVGPTLTLDSTPANPNIASQVATFTFSSPDALSFQCQLDAVAWTTCTSPYNSLVSDGAHVFRVRGFDANNTPTMKTYTWHNQGPHVTTSAGGYDNGAGITVSWSGLPGNTLDWISVAPTGSNDSTVTHRIYTNGATSGSASLPAITTNGTYVSRAYVNDTFTKVAEGTKFSVTTPCSPLSWSPDTNIRNPGDLASLAAYTNLGNLTISPTVSFAVDLPCLETVAGLFVNDNNGTAQITALRAPRLTQANALAMTNGPAILEVPKLATITSALALHQTPLPDFSTFSRLVSFGTINLSSTNGVVPSNAFESVTSVPTNFRVQTTGVRFDGLNNVTSIAGNLEISTSRFGGLDRLVTIGGNLTVDGELEDGLTSLKSVGGDVFLRSLSGAPIVRLPSLETIDGHLWVKPIATSGSPIIQRLSLPVLRRVYRLTVEGILPSSLEYFDAPLLTEVTYQVEFRGLAQMGFCELYNLIDQLSALPTYVTNGMSGGQYGTCTYNF